MEFSKTPLLKYLILIIIGILIESYNVPLLYAYILFTIGFCVFLFSLLTPIKKYRQYIFPFAFSIFTISIFWIHASFCRINDSINTDIKPYYVFARINEIEQKDISTSVVAKTVGATDSTYNRLNIAPQKILIAIEGNDYSLNIGDIIAFIPKFEHIKNMGNPYEFDYARYMGRKGIFYKQFLHRKEYIDVGSIPTPLNYATKIRNIIIRKILESEINPSSQEFLISVITGDKSYLDDDIHIKFTNVGMAHILALSGLHLAIIGFIIYLILFPMDYIENRHLRIIITNVALIAYAFITGCSPSVMRALIMSIMASIAIISYKKPNISNAICASAILILIFNPEDLFEIGFQLSFLAITTITTLLPLFNPFSPKAKIKFKISNLLLLPITATLGTWIISAYYFHGFPTAFLIPNILIIPFMPFIVSIGIVSFVTNIEWICKLFDDILLIIYRIINWCNQLPESQISLNINFLQIVIYYCLLISIMLLFKNKFKRNYLWSSIILMFLFYSTFLFKRQTNAHGFVVFNDYHETPILLYENNRGIFLPTIDNSFLMDFKRYQNQFFIENNIKSAKIYSNETDTPRILNRNFIYYKSKRIAIIDNKIPKVCLAPANRLKLDILIVTSNYYSTIKKLTYLYNTKLIVLSGNIRNERLNILKQECALLKIPFYSIGEQGAYCIN